MRWPDIFFKSRKSKPLPSIVTVPKSVEAPEKTEIARAETALAEKEKTESLRALADSGETAIASGKVPGKGDRPDDDRGNAKTTVLPAVTVRSGVSLRQRAKLTDDALVPSKGNEAPSESKALAKSTEDESAPKKTEATTPDAAAAAVVPSAFPVPVETGTVMEKTESKPASAEETRVTDAKPETEKPAPLQVDSASASKEATDPVSPARDTARVHLAHTTTSGPVANLEPVKPDTREKMEFILANGERILGHVLSETPQTIYLDHGTLGVLTLPRSQIAAKPIEVILINGDRIVGDLIAETPDCLYIKHASLGMLTVPHGQRSTRVVEAILKDGDRILGEVLAETDNFTVIRSATLGTVAVQHDHVAMLNRKIEQMQLRALAPGASAPALENKKD